MQGLKEKNLRAARNVAAKYRNSEATLLFMQNYINDRLDRYRDVMHRIREERIQEDDTFRVAVLLWDRQLFFEVHDWLEKQWLKAVGQDKEILQALIRAAGTYVLLEHGRTGGAMKMAGRASAALERHRNRVPGVFDVDLLITKLRTLDPIPPKFLQSPTSSSTKGRQP